MLKEKNLMWIVIIITAMGLSFKIIYDNFKNSTKLEEICYIDTPRIIEKLSLYYSINPSRNLSDDYKKANLLINNLKLILNNPKKFGCKTILMKGAILSGGKDITKEVLQNVWNAETK